MSGDAQDAPPQQKAAPPGARRADPLMATAAAAMDRAVKSFSRAGTRLSEGMSRAFARENPHSDDLPPATAPGAVAPIGRSASPKKKPALSPRLLLDAAAAGFSLGAVGLLGFLFGAFVYLAPRPADDADLWAVNRSPSVVILDRNGEELAARGARYGQQVSVSELPPYLVKAIVATEDRRFFEHRGVDFRGSLRALLSNLRAGRVVEGGSTITQQLARNLFLSFDQNYTRKAKEALLALWIEGRYSKEQILSIYLNRIYFGAGAYGIDSAARTYFGKSAREVSLAEAVMLAGLPKAPSQLAPTLNPGGAQNRANEVLQNLRETGAISEFEALDAVLHPAVVAGGDSNADIGWFFDYVAEKAYALVGGPTGMDLIVTTTLDRKMQRVAEAAVKSALGVEARTAGAEQAALVAYDVNGAVRAMVGGRSYLESQFNRATQALRQPGSAFKPILYAAALENGVTPDSIFVDQPVDIDGWRPENYTPGYQGRMRLTEAVAKSTNTIAVQVSEMIGRGKTVEMGKRLGIKSDLQPIASIALGGVNVTLEELAAAYIPFADAGWAPDTYAIDRIENQNLELLYERPAVKPRRAIAEETAEGMTHLLYQVMTTGTGAGARLSNRDAVGKTGTTNDWRDAWFIGYSAQLVTGVWVGNDDFSSMQKVTGGTIPARIWKDFMAGAHQDLPRLPLKGAYPAATYADESLLLGFYRDVAEGLREVRRDGDVRDGRRRRR
jgi:penicillin-binding protein 1A